MPVKSPAKCLIQFGCPTNVIKEGKTRKKTNSVVEGARDLESKGSGSNISSTFYWHIKIIWPYICITVARVS